jgi:hypothetical protein
MFQQYHVRKKDIQSDDQICINITNNGENNVVENVTLILVED